MTTLRVIIDQMIAPVPGGIGRYAEEITRALIETAPPGCHVTGVASALSPDQQTTIRTLLPGLSELHTSNLSRRGLSLASQYGLSRVPGKGMLHAPSLLAPLSPHDRLNNQSDQVVVTIHDVVPWTHPQTLTRHGVRWHKAMVKRALKYADAVVVPTHAVARELTEIHDFGDRIRVIGGAVSSKLRLPVDADTRLERLHLPPRYLLAVGTLEPRKGIDALIRALALPQTEDLPLMIVGPGGWGDVGVRESARQAGLSPDRVRSLGFLDDPDLAAVMDRAEAFVYPSLAEGFGLPVLEALSLGTPVVHSDAPALMEVASGAGIAVERDDPASYPERLADAIGRVLTDAELTSHLRLLGVDRASAFSWRASAESVWQLHADL